MRPLGKGWVDRDSPVVKIKVMSTRRKDELLDYAASLKLDAIMISDLDAYGSLVAGRPKLFMGV